MVDGHVSSYKSTTVSYHRHKTIHRNGHTPHDSCNLWCATRMHCYLLDYDGIWSRSDPNLEQFAYQIREFGVCQIVVQAARLLPVIDISIITARGHSIMETLGRNIVARIVSSISKKMIPVSLAIFQYELFFANTLEVKPPSSALRQWRSGLRNWFWLRLVIQRDIMALLPWMDRWSLLGWLWRR